MSPIIRRTVIKTPIVDSKSPMLALIAFCQVFGLGGGKGRGGIWRFSICARFYKTPVHHPIHCMQARLHKARPP